MQEQETTLSSAKFEAGNRRSLGKAMPIKELLLQSVPQSMSSRHLSYMNNVQSNKYIISDDFENKTLSDMKEVDDDNGADMNLEVSHCSNGGRDNEQEEKFCIAGNSKTYTPCLRCTGSASNDFVMRDFAINEMCRKFCTDNCRLQLSLIGFEPTSDATLRSVNDLSALTQHSNSNNSPSLSTPNLPSAFCLEHLQPSKIDLQRQKFLNDTLQESNEPNVSPFDDSCENKIQKDFREKSEIAEALARTCEITSTTQVKQRLAARKLEIEMDKANLDALTLANDRYTSQGVPVATRVAADACQQQASDVEATQNGSDYEPPRDLLLYLVRMGSFNSTPKIHNTDSQDDSLEIPKGLSNSELLQHVKHLRGDNQPPLLSRYFLKPLDAPLVTPDITDGLRFLKLNSVPKIRHLSPNRIRLLQWNILSQTLGQNNDGFVQCPDEALTWENRKYLIVQEILQTDPDIICLQEVDHFKFLQKILGSQDYDGIFFPKPDSPCLYIEENNGPDGCAIFYKRNKFELKNFDTRILEVWRVQSNQVAIAANLKVKATGEEVCVCTTHLKARHGSLLSKLRNEQGRDLLRFVKKIAEERPVLICGDFNAEPMEPVYSTMLNCDILRLSSAYADIQEMSEMAEKCNGKAEKPETEEEIDKAAASMKREPPYTTWKIREDGEECHTIDYVFYTKNRLEVKNCLDFPLGDEIGKNRTPSFQYPSDHFSLVCDFEIMK